jgi:hypothetical protein
MYDAAQTPICPNCGSAETGSVFCKKCGATLQTVAPMITSGEADSERRWDFWGFSKRDLICILLAYVFFFLSLRFDILHRGPWFVDRMPIVRAAWVAILYDMFFAVIYKIRFGDEYMKK